MGFIIRDSEGFVIGGVADYKDNMACINWAEVDAIQMGIRWVTSNGLDNCIF